MSQCVTVPPSLLSERGLVGRGDAAHRHGGQTRGQDSQLQGEEEERQRCRHPGPAAGQQASGRHRLQQQQVVLLLERI